MKRRRRVATVIGLTSAALIALAMPAQAVEGSWQVGVTGCTLEQQVQLRGSPLHDYMRWSTIGTCGAGSWGNIVSVLPDNTIYEKWNFYTAGTHTTSWYYDGPGYDLQVCVNGPTGEMACGPDN